MQKIFISGTIVEIYEYENCVCGRGGLLNKITDENIEKIINHAW